MPTKKRSRHIPALIKYQLDIRHPGACEYCNEACEPKPETHHIKPFAKGGAHTLANLMSLCPNCHRKADRNMITQQELKQIAGKFSAENKRISSMNMDEIERNLANKFKNIDRNLDKKFKDLDEKHKNLFGGR